MDLYQSYSLGRKSSGRQFRTHYNQEINRITKGTSSKSNYLSNFWGLTEYIRLYINKEVPRKTILTSFHGLFSISAQHGKRKKGV